MLKEDSSPPKNQLIRNEQLVARQMSAASKTCQQLAKHAADSKAFQQLVKALLSADMLY